MNLPSDVFELVKKNLTNLIRAKAGSLVVILGPLLVILFAGLAFDNSNAYAVKIGTYVPAQNNITTTFLDQLRKEFKVVEYTKEEDCIEAIKETDINTCMVFSGNFTIGMPDKNKITFHVDYSRVNLVWTIMQVMTKEVSERTLQASQSLTKILLDTLDYTNARVQDQREEMVKLATQNELMHQNVQDLMAELGDIDLSFNEKEYNVGNLSSAKTQVKQWVDTALSIGDKGLSKATSFIDAAGSIVKQSSASQESKDALIKNMQKAVDDIKKLKADFAETKNLTQASFTNFDKQLTALNKAISNTKSALTQADTSRQFSLRVLEAISGLLDQSLVSLSTVQNALNDIENRITAIEIRDPKAISQPIVTAIKPIAQEKTYLNYLFPVLVVLIIMFTALLITPTLILLDKHSAASFRTYMTPVSDASYILANFITASILLFFQVVIILAIASIFFSNQIITNAPETILLLLMINSLFILIGMAVGYMFHSEEAATLGAVSVGALFLFISDVIIPIETMPEIFAYIASFNPYVLGSSLLRRAFLFDAPLLSLLEDILIMLGYIIAAALIASGIYLLTRRYSMQQLAKKLAPVFARVRFRKK
jgi:ABC-type multidrug transport system permease subunit